MDFSLTDDEQQDFIAAMCPLSVDGHAGDHPRVFQGSGSFQEPIA
jgi:hypothetical protein